MVAVSKRYKERNAFPCWYAYHPDWDAYLAEAERSFILFGFADSEAGYAVPREVMKSCTAALNATTRQTTGKLHWHVHLVERGGGMALLLPKRGDELDLTPYRLAG